MGGLVLLGLEVLILGVAAVPHEQGDDNGWYTHQPKQAPVNLLEQKIELIEKLYLT